METSEAPKSLRLGVVPSSIHWRVCWVPAAQEVLRTGAVIWRSRPRYLGVHSPSTQPRTEIAAKAEGMAASATREVLENMSNRKEWTEKRVEGALGSDKSCCV